MIFFLGHFPDFQLGYFLEFTVRILLGIFLAISGIYFRTPSATFFQEILQAFFLKLFLESLKDFFFTCSSRHSSRDSYSGPVIIFSRILLENPAVILLGIPWGLYSFRTFFSNSSIDSFDNPLKHFSEDSSRDFLNLHVSMF